MSLDILEQDQLRHEKAGRLLALKPVLEQNFGPRTCPLSARSFAGLFGWLDFFDFEIRNIRDELCVFASHELGTFLYLPPAGEAVSAGTIRECFAVMEDHNGGKGVSRVENAGLEDLRLFDPEQFDVVLKGYEYCYFRDDIAGLKGNPFKSQRSSYNQFVSNHRFEWLPFVPQMRAECTALYDKWAGYKKSRAADDIYCHMLEENRAVHDLLMEYCHELELTGRVVRIQGKIAGYTFGCALNDKVFCILLEITDPIARGLPTFVFREFCRDWELQPYRFINAMDDFGMPGVAATKLAFRPSFLLPAYVISKKDQR
jgi:hypothetical protein